jgi:hypothetical protein
MKESVKWTTEFDLYCIQYKVLLKLGKDFTAFLTTREGIRRIIVGWEKIRGGDCPSWRTQ